MLKTFVKISTINNLSDARYCAGMGVEMLGFALDSSDENHIESEKFKEICSWVRGVGIVGETQSSNIEQIKKYVENYELDFLQISDPSLLPNIQQIGKPILLCLALDDPYLKEALSHYAPFVEMFIIEGKELSDLASDKLKEIAQNYSLLLSFDIKEANVNEILAKIIPKGIVLKGSAEIRAGYKEFDEMMEILEALES